MNASDSDNSECKYLLDSAANPTQIHFNPNTSFPISYPTYVSTANGTRRITHASNVILPTTSGGVLTQALINPDLKESLLSPIPLFRQKGPVILTDTQALVLPPLHPATKEALRVTIPIAKVKNGVYEIMIPNKHTSISMKSMQMKTVPPPLRTPDHTRSIAHTLAPAATLRRKTEILRPTNQKYKELVPILRTPTSTKGDAILADAHLVLNHASPAVILKTLKNPTLQYSKNFSQQLQHNKLSCEACFSVKLKSAMHKRKLHGYCPGQALSSEVSRPFNFDGARLDNAYFFTCVDASSRYAFVLPIDKWTEVQLFVEKNYSIVHRSIWLASANLHQR